MITTSEQERPTGVHVIITAICDACRRALEGETTSVQISTGELVATVGGSVSLRNTRSPAAVNLCETCAQPLRQVLGQLIASGQRSRPQAPKIAQG